MENRDLRLVECTFKPGDMVWRGGNLDQDGRMVYANLLQAYQNLGRTATGYLVRKGWRDSNVAPADNSPLAYMIFPCQRSLPQLYGGRLYEEQPPGRIQPKILESVKKACRHI